MNILIMGPPGSGKGTISSMIREKYGFCHISAGSIIREEIKKRTPLGKDMKLQVETGHLVEPNKVVDMVREKMIKEDCQNYIIDGIPRSVEQAEYFDKKISTDFAIYLKLSDEIAIKRLSNRYQCPECKRIYNLNNNPPKITGICNYDGAKLFRRADDNPHAISERLELFHSVTKKVIDWYSGILIQVDADAKPERILESIESKINFK